MCRICNFLKFSTPWMIWSIRTFTPALYYHCIQLFDKIKWTDRNNCKLIIVKWKRHTISMWTALDYAFFHEYISQSWIMHITDKFLWQYFWFGSNIIEVSLRNFFSWNSIELLQAWTSIVFKLHREPNS